MSPVVRAMGERDETGLVATDFPLPPATQRVPLLSEEDSFPLYSHYRAIRQRDFIRCWVRYGKARTDAPAEFHEMVAIALVAATIDRNRWLDLQHKRVYPSVYVIGLAASGQRKTTPLAYGTVAALNVLNDRSLANEFSPEALIADLDARPGLSRGIAFIDEAGRLLGTMRKHQYGETLKDLFSQLWDAPERWDRRLMKNSYRLESVYPNLVMTTTLSRFSDVVSAEDIQTGFLARFLPVVVTRPIARKPLVSRGQEIEIVEEQLISDLGALRDQLSEKPNSIPIAPRALDRLNAAEQALEEWAAAEFHGELVEPWARRLSEYAQRLSVIFAVSEGVSEVDLYQVLRALSVIERAKEGVLTIVEELTKGAFARELDKVERFIRENPGISLRDLYRRASLTSERARVLIVELRQQGRIVSRPEGRYYVVVNPNAG